MQKHRHGLRFHHIMRIGALRFRYQNRLGNALCTGTTLFHTFSSTSGAQVGPKGAPGEPKGAKRNPTASPGTPKRHKKDRPGAHLGGQGRPTGSRGTLGKANHTKTTKKLPFSVPLGMKKLVRVTHFQSHTIHWKHPAL